LFPYGELTAPHIHECPIALWYWKPPPKKLYNCNEGSILWDIYTDTFIVVRVVGYRSGALGSIPGAMKCSEK
jgi:hypothetical protein